MTNGEAERKISAMEERQKNLPSFVDASVPLQKKKNMKMEYSSRWVSSHLVTLQNSASLGETLRNEENSRKEEHSRRNIWAVWLTHMFAAG